MVLAPSIFVRSNGEVDVVAVDSSGSMAYYSAPPSSTGEPGLWNYTQLTGSDRITSTPSMFVRSNGEVDIVAQGFGDSLWYYWATPGSAWNSTEITSGGSGTTLSALSISVRSNGEIDILTAGPSNDLMYYWSAQGSVWNIMTPVIAGGGIQAFTGSMFVRSDGGVDVAAVSPNNDLVYYWATPGSAWDSSAWKSAKIASGGIGSSSAPSIFVRSNGEVDVVAVGLDGSLRYYWATPSSIGKPGLWNSTEIAFGSTTESASMFVRSNGEVDVVAVGGLNNLRYYWAAPGSAWSSMNIGGY